MTRLIVITGFIVAFVAGAMAGVAWKQYHTPGKADEGRRGGRDSWIADQLTLTPEQQKQMKEIWSDVSHRGSRDSGSRRGQIRKEQEEAIFALIPDSQRGAYDQILKESKQKFDALEAEGKKRFQQAVEKTKVILTEEQRKKYEELLSRPPPPPPGRDGRENRDRPATKPGNF